MGVQGFGLGFGTGLILPVVWFLSFFIDVSIYNNALDSTWYDVGYILGVLCMRLPFHFSFVVYRSVDLSGLAEVFTELEIDITDNLEDPEDPEDNEVSREQ